MLINEQQILEFNEVGFLQVNNCFNLREMGFIREAVDSSLQDTNYPGLVMEETGKVARGVHGPHFNDKRFLSLARDARLLQPAMTILKKKVYIQQYKINIKAAFVGGIWDWHQDFTFFHNEDRVESPELITAAIFIDPVTEFNGPLTFIPGSHKHNYLGAKKNSYEEYDNQNSWLSNMTAKLRYTVDKSLVERLVETHGLIAPKGESGTVIFFHCNLFHCSSTNMSPFDRKVIFITYNVVDNFPKNHPNPRPEFLACRDYNPLELMTDSFGK